MSTSAAGDPHGFIAAPELAEVAERLGVPPPEVPNRATGTGRQHFVDQFVDRDQGNAAGCGPIPPRVVAPNGATWPRIPSTQ